MIQHTHRCSTQVRISPKLTAHSQHLNTPDWRHFLHASLVCSEIHNIGANIILFRLRSARNKYRTELADEHLSDILHMSASDIEPYYKELVEGTQCQVTLLLFLHITFHVVCILCWFAVNFEIKIISKWNTHMYKGASTTPAQKLD